MRLWSDLPMRKEIARAPMPYAITEEWRARMVAAREEAGLKQSELARAVRARQSTISLIESGETKISRLVEPISRALKIGMPDYNSVDARDEFSRRWDAAALGLLSQSQELADAALDLVETLLLTHQKK